ncbi:MAG: DNA repair protein RadA [candidate division Zixibacteria bacterium]|nr:DNA repair protein RadA [candidate division Zixibacteria bacterium]
MAIPDKIKTIYICQVCGYKSPRWLGKCPECGTWDSLVEEKIAPTKRWEEPGGQLEMPIPVTKITKDKEERIITGAREFDRVMGGGIVNGSVTLVGGDPGIGKSTLLLQISESIALKNKKVLYVSGEESAKQLKIRAERLGVLSDNLEVLAENNLHYILAILSQRIFDVVVIDSIQTSYTQELESAPGSVSQIRECAYQFINYAKTSGSSFFLIGHVTKEGAIAGPKILEHMVDTVLYFEGEKSHTYRLLRSVKNRFGSTNELGIFQMMEKGLVEVENPSRAFLSERRKDSPGSVVICSIEGTRPLLLELQALVTPSTFGMPQRVCSGVDYKRVSLLLAVLEKMGGVGLSKYDVFVNLAGGVRIEEPALDLGIITAIASSYRDMPIDPEAVVIGEVGLSGEIRTVDQRERRIKEAEKLGFKRCILSQGNLKEIENKFSIQVIGVKEINETFKKLFIQKARRSETEDK